MTNSICTPTKKKTNQKQNKNVMINKLLLFIIDQSGRIKIYENFCNYLLYHS